jgi:hypothetical protein
LLFAPHSSIPRHRTAWFGMLVLILSIGLLGVFPVSAMPQGSAVPAPVAPSPSSTKPAVLHYEVRWLNNTNRFFGATFNISLSEQVRQSDWSIYFQFAVASTKVIEYWGDWEMKDYTAGRYQIIPKNIKPDRTGKLYFSFNGHYYDGAKLNGMAGLLPENVLLQRANEIIPLSTVDRTLVNIPVSTRLPSRPFSIFARRETEKLMQQTLASDNAQSGSDHLAAVNTTESEEPAEKEQGSFLGLYITIGIFGVLFAVVGVAAVTRTISRKRYREAAKVCHGLERGEQLACAMSITGDASVAVMAPTTATQQNQYAFLQHPPPSAQHSHTSPNEEAPSRAQTMDPNYPTASLIKEYLPPEVTTSMLRSDRTTVLGPSRSKRS